jgi:hypothetical protein
MLLLDERRAVEAIPGMLARDGELASRLIDNVRRLLAEVGLTSKIGKERLAEIEAFFEKYNQLEHAGAHLRSVRPRSQPAGGGSKQVG